MVTAASSEIAWPRSTLDDLAWFDSKIAKLQQTVVEPASAQPE
jgi:hypothetical protein